MTFFADRHIGRSAMRRVKVVEVKDTGTIQMVTVQGLKGEFFKFPYRGQPHGLTTVPTVGSVGYLFMASGRPDQAFLMGLEDPQLRPSGKAEGETWLYAKKGQTVELNDDGDLLIRSPSGVVHINP